MRIHRLFFGAGFMTLNAVACASGDTPPSSGGPFGGGLLEMGAESDGGAMASGADSSLGTSGSSSGAGYGSSSSGSSGGSGSTSGSSSSGTSPGAPGSSGSAFDASNASDSGPTPTGTGSGAAPDCSTATSWSDGNETVFESYPPPGSAECIQYSGCLYEGQFQACSQTLPLSWVQAHNIFSIFPNLGAHQYHWICLRDPGSGNTIAGLALDTCADSDCNGCCTQNLGSASLLIDVEINTDMRFTNLGINGGQPVQWADMGPADPSAYAGCN